jgi:hypothetical protein
MRECKDKSLEVENNEGNWKFRYKAMVDSFSVERNELGEQIAYQDQLLINEKQAKEMLAMENSSLKKITSSTKVKTVTKLEKIYIPLEEIVDAKVMSSADTVVTTSYRPFELNTKWYSIRGKVLDQSILIDSLSTYEELTTNIGWKKDKFWKSKYAVVETKSLNPNTSIVGMQNVVVKPPKPKRISIGPNISLTYTGGKFVPQIGIGIQYDIIRF